MHLVHFRYTDHINNDDNVRSLIQGAISLVKKVVKKKGMNDLEVKTLWLSNLLRIIHNLKQYSGEKQFQNESTQKQIDQSLRNFDLSEYRRVLSDIAIWIYHGITKLIEEEIQPILVPAVLEHEGIGEQKNLLFMVFISVKTGTRCLKCHNHIDNDTCSFSNVKYFE